MESMKKKKYHYPADLKQDLLQKGIEIIQSHGIEGLTLKSLAGSLGVTSAAMYHHYSHKTALFIAIVEKHLDDLTNLLDDTVFTPYKNNPDMLLMQSALCFFEFCEEHADFLLLISSDNIRSWNDVEPVSSRLNYCFGVVLSTLAEGQKQNRYRQGKPELLLATLFSSVYGFASLVFNNRLGFMPQVDREARNFFFEQVCGTMKTLKGEVGCDNQELEALKKQFAGQT